MLSSLPHFRFLALMMLQNADGVLRARGNASIEEHFRSPRGGTDSVAPIKRWELDGQALERVATGCGTPRGYVHSIGWRYSE